MYRTIIVPIDLSQEEKGRDILDRACKLADAGASIILVNVVEELPAYVLNELPAGLRDESARSAQLRLEGIAKESGLQAEVVVRSGHAANEILLLADERNADLIMVASHRPGLQDYFIGSTAGRVVRHAGCSVLVTR